MRRMIAVALVVGLGLGAASAHAASLSVDIGLANQTGAGLVQTGFIGWDLDATGNSPKILNLVDPFGTGDNVTVTLSAMDGTFGTAGGTRDRGVVGPTASPLSNLLRDFIFETTASEVTLSFTGLPRGFYSIDTIHHDDDFAQGNADVFLTDALVSEQAVGNANTTTNGNLPAFGVFSTDFFANGADPVSLRFDTNGNQMFNGFTLDFTPVPEPSSVAMWGLLGLTAVVWTWARRRRRAKLD